MVESLQNCWTTLKDTLVDRTKKGDGSSEERRSAVTQVSYIAMWSKKEQLGKL